MNRHRSMAFYMECLLLTVFLLGLTAVLAQLFSAARTQALEARRLTDAQRLARNVSEEFYAAADEADFLRLAGLEETDAAGGEVERTGPSGESYRLSMELTEQPQTAGRTVTLRLAVRTTAGEELCSFDFVRYWPD